MRLHRVLSTVMASLALVLACVPASAQQQGGRGRGRGEGLSLMRLPAPLAEKLGLNAEQKTKLEALSQKVRAEGEAIRASAGNDRQAAAAKLRDLNMKTDAEASAILSPDQKKIWDGWAADHREIAGLGRPATALLMVAGLSGEQKGKLKTLSTETGEKRRQLFEGAQGGNNPELRQKAQAMETETLAAIKAVLNADQVKQFDAALTALPQVRRRPNQN